MPDVLPSPTPSASPPSVRAVRELLAALRRPIDELCSRGLPNLAHPDGEERVLELAAQMADAAGALAAAFAGKSARTASEAEVLRRKKTAEDLAQLATSAKNLGRSPLGERQRVVALGLRLCAGVSMYLPQSTEKRSVSAVAPTPIAKPAPESKPAPKPESRPESDADDPLVQPLLGLPGVGPVTAEKLAVKGLTRVIDALYFLPKRYDDLRQVVPVGQLQPGVLQATVVLVERTKVVWARKRFLEVMFRGEDGCELLARWFYFHGGYQKRLLPGKRFLLTATPSTFRDSLQVTHPELTDLPPRTEQEGGVLPEGSGHIRIRYPDVEGVPGRLIERLCQGLCQQYAELVPDGVPAQLLGRLSLPVLPQALRELHSVPAETTPELLARLNEGLSPAQRRLIFEELFFLQLGLLRRRRAIAADDATVCVTDDQSLARLRAVLPFQPTGAQERAIAEIRDDLKQPHPMQRLLHGDVGSGKTLVAYAACELVMASGHQAAVMAPTEILAEQHYKTLRVWAQASGRKLALLTATTPKTARKTTVAQLQAGRFADVLRIAEATGQPLDRESILAMLSAGFLDMVVGTHALIAEAVEFKHLALVVIDEQHRFGVGQRAALRRKGRQPHILVMTATPIPRTLALTLYGDLDVSQLDELPPGRTPAVTKVLPARSGEGKALQAVRKAVETGRQAYWVCPLIEDSDKLELSSATARHAALTTALPELKVGLVHGRLSSDERDDVMGRFRQRELDVLVATTVIEVGVDVPNASLMVIESAERFGLAQLHQLRGRVGRGSGKSACLLLHGVSAEATSTQRLEVVAATSDGFRLAEADLRIRGPGEVLGTRQSGLPPLRFADLLRDIDLLTIARREAAALLSRDPDLSRPEHVVTQRVLAERWAHCDLTLE
ncbi:MAG: ATP-dependent DNA helicase RecG [Deltaproteobacteria bacterium]|jgi:ATP-dependent DNA helicase RecG|nr:ATP-dependent DNA helicase RecG [Deltaproteobacteria bacterium]